MTRSFSGDIGKRMKMEGKLGLIEIECYIYVNLQLYLNLQKQRGKVT